MKITSVRERDTVAGQTLRLNFMHWVKVIAWYSLMLIVGSVGFHFMLRAIAQAAK